MRFNVTFRCTLPTDPAGEELAEYLAAKLRERSFDMYLDSNSPDFAWVIADKARFPAPWLLVGYVGDGEYEWLAQINSSVSWFGRLLGRSDDSLRRELTEKLHAIISEDAAFSDIRWHEGDFAKPGWTHSP